MFKRFASQKSSTNMIVWPLLSASSALFVSMFALMEKINEEDHKPVEIWFLLIGLILAVARFIYCILNDCIDNPNYEGTHLYWMIEWSAILTSIVTGIVAINKVHQILFVIMFLLSVSLTSAEVVINFLHSKKYCETEQLQAKKKQQKKQQKKQTIRDLPEKEQPKIKAEKNRSTDISSIQEQLASIQEQRERYERKLNSYSAENQNLRNQLQKKQQARIIESNIHQQNYMKLQKEKAQIILKKNQQIGEKNTELAYSKNINIQLEYNEINLYINTQFNPIQPQNNQFIMFSQKQYKQQVQLHQAFSPELLDGSDESESEQYGGRYESESEQYGGRYDDGSEQYGGRYDDGSEQYGGRDESESEQYGGRDESESEQYGGRDEGESEQYGGRDEGESEQYGGRNDGGSEWFGD